MTEHSLLDELSFEFASGITLSLNGQKKEKKKYISSKYSLTW